LLKTKSEVGNCVRDFVSYTKIHFNSRVKNIRSDNGPEFKLYQFYSEHDILHQTSCRETVNSFSASILSVQVI